VQGEPETKATPAPNARGPQASWPARLFNERWGVVAAGVSGQQSEAVGASALAVGNVVACTLSPRAIKTGRTASDKPLARAGVAADPNAPGHGELGSAAMRAVPAIGQGGVESRMAGGNTGTRNSDNSAMRPRLSAMTKRNMYGIAPIHVASGSGLFGSLAWETGLRWEDAGGVGAGTISEAQALVISAGFGKPLAPPPPTGTAEGSSCIPPSSAEAVETAPGLGGGKLIWQRSSKGEESGKDLLVVSRARLEEAISLAAGACEARAAMTLRAVSLALELHGLPSAQRLCDCRTGGAEASPTLLTLTTSTEWVRALPAGATVQDIAGPAAPLAAGMPAGATCPSIVGVTDGRSELVPEPDRECIASALSASSPGVARWMHALQSQLSAYVGVLGEQDASGVATGFPVGTGGPRLGPWHVAARACKSI